MRICAFHGGRTPPAPVSCHYCTRVLFLRMMGYGHDDDYTYIHLSQYIVFKGLANSWSREIQGHVDL